MIRFYIFIPVNQGGPQNSPFTDASGGEVQDQLQNQKKLRQKCVWKMDEKIAGGKITTKHPAI